MDDDDDVDLENPLRDRSNRDDYLKLVGLRTGRYSEFSHWVEHRSNMEVLLICGNPNKREFWNGTEKLRTFLVRLTNGISIQASNIFEGPDVSKIAIYCPHPEYRYHDYSVSTGEWLDAYLNLTTALADINGLDHDYSRLTKYFNDKRLDLISNKHAQTGYGFLRVAHNKLDIKRISGHSSRIRQSYASYLELDIIRICQHGT